MHDMILKIGGCLKALGVFQRALNYSRDGYMIPKIGGRLNPLGVFQRLLNYSRDGYGQRVVIMRV